VEDNAFREANVRPASPAGKQQRQPRYNLRSRPHRVERQVTENDAPELPTALPAAPVVAARRSVDEQPRADLEEQERESGAPEALGTLPATPEASAYRTEGEQCNDNESANSPESVSWREKVARQVLQVESPSAVPSEAAACVQLLKGVLTEIANGNLPNKKRLEEVDRRIEELFHAHEPGRKPDR